ncbi:MAG: cytokinin riboside 5'-monophosphate phosphoribohydrolase [marine bacterium B5-7]|nr:MAG: cytokinin riboside 5'-monophosphate phosphoribohydrolase [marine bacterium B5-7]
MEKVCVYCGSSSGKQPEYGYAARRLAKALTLRGIGVVYGGASVGIMGEIADAVLAGGGEVIGVIPQALADKEIAHEGLTELKIVGSMHERKQEMMALSDGFIALPGGLGTQEELFEALTWSQLGIHKKPCGLLNVEGYYDKLCAFLDHAVEEQFVKTYHREMLLVEDSPEKLLTLMETY